MTCHSLKIALCGDHCRIVSAEVFGSQTELNSLFSCKIRHSVPQMGVGGNTACQHQRFVVILLIRPRQLLDDGTGYGAGEGCGNVLGNEVDALLLLSVGIVEDGSFDAAHPIESLDCAILQANLLAPILGIDDPRTSERIDFVGGIRGLQELEARTGNGVAFSLYPVTMADLFHVADSGEIMPPKSTWFEPKLRSGLFLHEIER